MHGVRRWGSQKGGRQRNCFSQIGVYTSEQSAKLSASTGRIRLPFDGIAVRHQDTLLLSGRLVVAAIFVSSGLQKLTALHGFAANLTRARGFPSSRYLHRLGPAFFGGLAVALGFASRASALLMMVIFVMVATAISHRYWEFEGAARARVAQGINFEKNFCIIGGFMLLFAVGPADSVSTVYGACLTIARRKRCACVIRRSSARRK
jgi:putative oxidoreductase